MRLKFWATLDVQAGIPDIVGCVYSRGIFIELKGPNTKVTMLQRESLADWHHAGGIAGILREEDDHLIFEIGGHLANSIKLSRANWLQELLEIYLAPTRTLPPT
jgi:hypothetical protein